MTRRYIGPVILAEEVKEPTKERTVEIYKNEVYKDIDLYTYKHVDAREDLGNQSGNAISSDASEDVDAAVIARYVEFRDAELRTKLQYALAEHTNDYADDDLTLEDNKYHYYFRVSESFNDNVLKPLAEYIHRYLVWGALFDWYSQFGMNQAAVYGTQLDGYLSKINSILRGPSIVKRPMQPFGPAEKIY